MSWKRAFVYRAAQMEHRVDSALKATELVPSLDTIQGMLKECTDTKDLQLGRRVLSLVRRDHLESMPILTDQLIRMFASCGSLHYANHAFGKIINPSLYTWHAIISAHASLGHNHIALEMFYCVYYLGSTPNKFLFTCILKVCAHVGAFGTGKLLHHAIVCVSAGPDVIVGCALVDMYLRCGCLHDANHAFEKQINRNVVIWGAMIGGCTELGQSVMAFHLFDKMQNEGLNPDRVIYICLLKACVLMQSISQCILVNAMIVESSLNDETSIVNSLVDMYSKVGMFEDAMTVFNKQQHKDIISWGALISGYAQHGHGDVAFRLFEEMLLKGMKPNTIVVLCVLKACTKATQVHYIYDMSIKSTIVVDRAIGNALVDTYAKCGCLEEAHLVFDRLKYRDEISWCALITGYAQNGISFPALDLLVEMEDSGIKFNKFSISCGLKACGGIGAILEGRSLHESAVRNGLDSITVVGNALIDMYAKCGSLEEARRSFDRLSDCDSVSWAAMIGGYADYGLSCDALELFAFMNQKGIEPGKVSFLSILKASSNLESLSLGKLSHDQLIRSGFEADITIGNTLVDMYCKCGGLEEALKAFNLLSDHTVVSWSAIIAGHVQHEHGFTALQLFERMHKEGVEPNRSIYLSSLKACGIIGAVTQGSIIHDWVLRSGCAGDLGIGNTLIDMYAKCGCVEEANIILQGLQTRSDVSWAAIIVAYASLGNTPMVQQCLQDMLQEGIRPNGTVFMSILMACSHAGEIDKGKQFFKSMLEVHNIAPSNEHFTCMIDLLGRAGRLLEAKHFLRSMPISSDVSGWMALLTACDMYSNVELARGCFDELVKLDPECTSGFQLMLKVFADANMCDDVYEMERAMSSFTRSTMSGNTWIDIDDSSEKCVAKEKNIHSIEGLYPNVRHMRTSKGEGFVAQASGALEQFNVCFQQSAASESLTRNIVELKQSCQISYSDLIFNKQSEVINKTSQSQNLRCSSCFLWFVSFPLAVLQNECVCVWEGG